MATRHGSLRRLADLQASYSSWLEAMFAKYPAQAERRSEYSVRARTAGLGRVLRDLGGTTNYRKGEEVLVWEPGDERLRATHWLIFEPTRTIDALVFRESIEPIIMPESDAPLVVDVTFTINSCGGRVRREVIADDIIALVKSGEVHALVDGRGVLHDVLKVTASVRSVAAPTKDIKKGAK